MPSLPDRYKQLVTPLGVTGAIKVEASPWVEDNQWVLDLIAKEPMIVGVIGNIEPGSPDFKKHFDRFHKNPLFLGIRYGNLWNNDFHAGIAKPQTIADIKTLASAGLTMDTANPTPALIQDLVQLTDKVPGLRLVIDHLPKLDLPTDAAGRKAYEANLEQFRNRPNAFVKLSAVLREVNGKVPTDLAFYKATLDHIFDIFGENRVLFGSDFPNSDNVADYKAVLTIVQQYFAGKSQAQREKYFWKNSVAAYHWKKRAANQPSL